MREVDRKKTQNNNNNHNQKKKQQQQQLPTTRQRDNNNKQTADRKETKSKTNASNNKPNTPPPKSPDSKATNPPQNQTAAVKNDDDDDHVSKSEEDIHKEKSGKDEYGSESDTAEEDIHKEKSGKDEYGSESDTAEEDIHKEKSGKDEYGSESDTAEEDIHKEKSGKDEYGSESDTASSSTGCCDSQLADGDEEKQSEHHSTTTTTDDAAAVVPIVETDSALNSSSQGPPITDNDNLITQQEKLEEEEEEEEEATSTDFDEISLHDNTERTNHESKLIPCDDANLQDDSKTTSPTVDDEKLIEQQLQEKIDNLEDELRQVAALEHSLYSITPEHNANTSPHKLHTPARRLSRLYIHACKHWAQSRRTNVARNIVSGLVLVSRTCGSDVSRLTYWLSNTVVLREIISQVLGSGDSRQMMTSVKMAEFTGGASCSGGGTGDLDQLIEDWQETRTFTAALERIESWIFLRVVDSIWWQIFAPNMQHNKCQDESDDDQGGGGRFSTDLWKNAFQDAYTKLCPVRASGNECGCLSVLAKMVMEQSVGRLDVAMFNAILRESANQIPTDPVSDPILDPSVLPIPAGDLSFGSGARLKNAVGNWSRWLSDSLGIESNQIEDEKHDNQETSRHKHTPIKCFRLLDELSDLLMLPKDMLLDRSVRKEVCPSITLPLIKRVLCNFSPDEFCPDDVPGEVLEALNAESVVERRLSTADLNSSCGGFPYTAKSIVYSLPDVGKKVAQIGGTHQQLGRVQSKDYTSDEEELNDLGSSLASILATDQNETAGFGVNFRYKLLREVWSVV